MLRSSISRRAAGPLLVASAVAALALAGAGAGSAARTATPSCKEKKGHEYCKGTVTLHVARTANHISSVTCFLDGKGHPIEIWKSNAVLLRMAFAPHSRKSLAASLIAYATRTRLINADIAVKIATGGLKGTFSGRTLDRKTAVSGSFTCK